MVSRGVVGVPCPTRWKNESKHLGIKRLELSESEGICSQKAAGEAGGEELRSEEPQGCQGEVSAGGAHVRHVQRSHNSVQQR